VTFDIKRVVMRLASLLALSMTLLPATSLADKAEAEQALSEIIFDSEQIRPDQIASTVESNGVVNIIFDYSVPENLKDAFIKKLRASPNIAGANITSGAVCIETPQ